MGGRGREVSWANNTWAKSLYRRTIGLLQEKNNGIKNCVRDISACKYLILLKAYFGNNAPQAFLTVFSFVVSFDRKTYT